MIDGHLRRRRGNEGPRSGRRVVSVFSGAGGLDLGLAGAGWQVLAQVEMDAACSGTLRRHAQHLGHLPTIIQAPIEEVDPGEMRRSLRLKRGELELLAGGPPCQPFTTTGLRQAITDRRASATFPTYLAFVGEFLPHALLLENVDGMLSAALKHRPLARRGPGNPPLAPDEQKGSFLRWLLGELVALGYAISWGVVEASDYGVPQRRQRSVLLGVRGSEPCYLPPATHGGKGLPRVRTLRDALRGVRRDSPIQPLSERKRQVFARIPPGGNWRDLPDDVRRETMGAAFHAEGGKGGWWRRLSWDAPAPTILGMPDHSSTALIHPDETRCLSIAECAALQSFPSWVTFEGRPREQYQQIGNAVPPLLGEALARHLSAHLDGVRCEPPPAPAWRKESANRRIGTQGWIVPRKRAPRLHFNGHVREDHVWADIAGEQLRLLA